MESRLSYHPQHERLYLSHFPRVEATFLRGSLRGSATRKGFASFNSHPVNFVFKLGLLGAIRSHDCEK